MGLGPDTSYSGAAKIYRKQQPDGTTFNGAVVTTEEVWDIGSLVQHYGQESYSGVVEPATCTFTITVGGTNIAQIVIQVCDGAGNPISGTPVDLDVILSDNTTGIGVTATAPSGGTSVTAGTVLQTYTANKAFYVQTNASGQITLQITDTAHTGYYIAVMGLPVARVSRQLVAGDY